MPEWDQVCMMSLWWFGDVNLTPTFSKHQPEWIHFGFLEKSNRMEQRQADDRPSSAWPSIGTHY
jgi:hypothetical protein